MNFRSGKKFKDNGSKISLNSSMTTFSNSEIK